jgi:hypothetical protein
MSKTCQCPKPPGGQVTCDDGQMAVCSVDSNGAVDAACYTPPSQVSRLELENWALAIVTGEIRGPVRPLSTGEYAIMKSETYHRPNGALVRFHLPDFMSSFRAG